MWAAEGVSRHATEEPTRPVEAVVETAIYAADLGAAESFYATVLGLPVIDRESGRHVFFRVGAANVLLVFNPDATLAGGALPPNGSRGPGHFALGVPVASLDARRDHRPLARSSSRSRDAIGVLA